MRASIYNGLSVNGGDTNISLLQYADDGLLVGEWSLANVKNLIYVLKCFHKASGLGINLNKSCISNVGVNQNEVDLVAHLKFCKPNVLPFIYLGLRVVKLMKTVNVWDDEINRVNKRLSSWKY